VSNSATPPVDSKLFRSIFGHLPTGVVIVTGKGPSDEPLGITIGSFASISLDPPLAGFFIGRTSRTWPLIAARGTFTANVLNAAQAELCWRFAKDATDGSRFTGLQVGTSANGSPVLPDVVATIDCTVHTTHVVGDHDLVVGGVTDVQVRNTSHPSMVFYKGKTGDARIDT
jgi:3-hydroxy-9,10-secoandrosta-1,3,5(10)-triene-9,17-dione monooxygenase reductase component